MPEPKEDISFWVHEGVPCHPFLEVRATTWQGIASNTTYLLMDFLYFYVYRKCGSKRLIVSDLTGCLNLSLISIICLRPSAWLFVATTSASGVLQESMPRLTWQEIQEDLVYKIACEAAVYWAFIKCQAYRRHSIKILPMATPRLREEVICPRT